MTHAQAHSETLDVITQLRAEIFTLLKPGPSQETVRQILSGAGVPTAQAWEPLDVMCHRLVCEYQSARRQLAVAAPVTEHLQRECSKLKAEVERLTAAAKKPARRRGRK